MKKIILLLMFCFVIQFTNAQNTCATAVPITSAGLYVITTVDGTQVPNPSCITDPDANPTKAEWYAYTPTANYNVTFSTDIDQNNPRIDTRVHVFTGNCASLSCLAGDDDGGSDYSSIVSFYATAGTTYYIAWDNRWSASGFTFQLTQSTVVGAPAITYTTQSIATVNSSYNICVADMNGDHKDDIVGVGSGGMKVHYQGVGGAFTIANIPVTNSATSQMPGWSLAAGDYNHDGFNDLILGSGQALSVWTSNNTGTAYTSFNPGNYIFCQRTNFADLNNDGNLDVFSCHDVAPNCYYLNDGAGNLTFYQSTVTPGAFSIGAIGGNYATLFTDFDNDGDTDVFVSKCSGPPCELHRNDGNGVYTDISALAQINVTPIQTWSSAIADFDNDGDMDVIITASAGTHRYFRNNLDTTNSVEEAFSNITAGSGWDTNASTNIDNIAYDFDNNGFVDVLGGGGKIMFNNGNSTFTPVTYSGISVGAVGDLNNDGFLDILNGSTVRYAVPNTNNWISVALNGIQSNSNGIGARIEIYGAWGKQIRDIRSGEGFKYMSTLNGHFGIGQATAITQLIIRWPSGIVDTVNNPAINLRLNITEGSTLAVGSFANNGFSLYPNPVNNVLNIVSKADIVMKSAQVFDLTGRSIIKAELINPTLNVDTLSSGTYILVLKDDAGNDYSQKFIKE
jgi:ASPIC and UnbV/FG-GAP-like repeat/Secretion system C-terminal sorting domain/FG-GAP repeat